MNVTMIVASDVNGVIGNKNRIPWKCSKDMQHFRDTTYGNIVIMGRKTWESIGSKPLPGRINIVISRHPNIKNLANNAMFIGCNSIREAMEHCYRLVRELSSRKVFVIGGSEIYSQFTPLVNNIIHTVILGQYEGDAHFRLPKGMYAQSVKTVLSDKLGEPDFVVTNWSIQDNRIGFSSD